MPLANVICISAGADAGVILTALKTRFETVFARFGTAPEHTRHAIFERSHALPIDDVVREILSWLDRYLGSVTHSSRASTPTL